jgi:hypothetical protein
MIREVLVLNINDFYMQYLLHLLELRDVALNHQNSRNANFQL